MKKSTVVFLTLVLLMSTVAAYAQNENSKLPPNKTLPNDSASVLRPDQIPAEFPGGTIALMKFINSNMQYPLKEKKLRIEGKVYVYFEIDTLGNVTNTKVTKGLTEALDSEALRIINAMPKWKPAINNNKQVKQRNSYPVKFNIKDYKRRKKQ